LLVYLLAVAVLLVAALLAFGGAALLHLQGGAEAVFIVLILLIGIAAAGLIVFLHLRAKKQQEAEGGGAGTGDSSEIDLLLNDANRKLKTSTLEGAKSLDELPLIYLLGDAGSAKTTLVVRSGLEPELLAGTAPRAGEADVPPTALLNLWFTRQAAILEAGQGIRQSNAALARLIQRTRPKAYRAAFGPGAPPRAAVVCVSAKLFLGTDAAASIASARATGAQLREISRLLGAALPVYVIVTKLDEVPNFAEYVRNLSNDEAQGVLGVTLKRSEASVGVYADQVSRALTAELEALCYSLGEFRVEALHRETDPTSAPRVYQFPYEFGKLFKRNGLTEYLVELSKPSQLSANPYLRGFYFTGVRAQTVEREAAAPAWTAPAKAADANATQMFNPEMLRQMQNPVAPQPVRSSVRVPQWVFLARLFPETVLGDRTALSATQQTAPARVFRRVLFATLASIFAIYSILLLVSYLNNNALENRIAEAAKALPVSGIPANAPASLTDLQTLDKLRQVIVELDGYHRDGAPWSYRFGLYQGDRLAVRARQAYFNRFRPLLLTPTQANFATYLGRLPSVPDSAAGDDASAYDAAYQPLRGYLITTTNPEKSTPAILSPVFVQYWSGGRPVTPDQDQLVRLQADFYAEELPRRNPYSIAPDMNVVGHARGYLANFGGQQRIYQNMLTAADKANSSINFNQAYPGSAEAVVDPVIVRGAFTRSGFAAMQDAIKNPDRYAHGETWVLGEQNTAPTDLAKLSIQLAAQYSTDYIKAWQDFLKAGRVVGCGGAGLGGLKGTGAMLGRLSGNSSPLLEFFYVLSHNTAVGDPSIKKIFQPAQVLVDSEATDRFVGTGNQPYMLALGQLSNAVAVIAQNPPASPDPAIFAPITGLVQAGLNAVTQTQQGFNVDAQFQTEKTVTALLKSPIDCAGKLVPAAGAVINGAGAQFCGTLGRVLQKQPFSPNASAQASLQEVDAIFAPESGALWTFYNGTLKPLLMQQGSQYVPAPNPSGGATPAFAAFFTRAAHISADLYPAGAKEPTFDFNLRFLSASSKGIQSATLVVDGQRILNGSTGQKFTWNGTSAHQASLVYDSIEIPQTPGTWALFQLVSQGQISRSQAGIQVDFPITTGIAGHATQTGRTANFELSGTGADLFGPGGISGLHCVSQVVKQ